MDRGLPKEAPLKPPRNCILCKNSHSVFTVSQCTVCASMHYMYIIHDHTSISPTNVSRIHLQKCLAYVPNL